MGVSTLGRTLDLLHECESRLSEYYADLADRATNPGAQLVAGYLARKRRIVAEAMHHYSSGEMDNILATPVFEDENVTSDLSRFQQIGSPSAEVSAERLLDHAIGFTQILIDSCHRIAEQRLGAKAVNFMEALHAIGVREIRELKKIKAMDYF